jgi:putative ABC transport system substrate-binding protein
MPDVRRRGLIALIRSAATAIALSIACPLAARAQPATMPVIGFLNSASSDMFDDRLGAFRQGLKDTGYVEGENVAIAYRWGNNQMDRVGELVAELVRRPVAVVVATGRSAALVVKAANTTIPVVIGVAEDPVRLGLVASLARPGGNITGVNFLTGELEGKRLEFLRQLVPTARRIAVLVSPASTTTTESTLRDVQAAARAMDLQIQVLNADSAREIDLAFATLVRERADALFVGSGPFFTTRRVQLAILAGRHVIPAVFSNRQYAEAGGLMSYGSNLLESYRQIGVYAGRILKGAKPADLPDAQPTGFELVINAQTARTLGLEVPATLLAVADEVIE